MARKPAAAGAKEPRGYKNPEDRLSAFLHFSLTDREAASIKARARASGMTLSAYVRQILADATT